MAISEERLQILVPKRLKQALRRQADRLGVSAGEYVRHLIEMDLRQSSEGQQVDFPFGKHPIHTGRTRGSVDHDRPR